MNNEELVLAIRAGQNVTENMGKLYEQNRGIIYKLAQKYKGIEDLEDLMQEAYLGLARAVELWNPEREVLFASYAVPCIKTQLYQYVTDKGAIIKVPANQKALIYKYKRCVNSFRVALGRDPEPWEMSALLEINNRQLEQLKKDSVMLNVRSTSEPIGGENDDIVLEDTIPAEGNQYDELLDKIQREELSRELWGFVDQLPEYEAAIIRHKYKNGQTYAKCGESLGLSIERVRQLHESAIRALKRPKVTRRLEAYLTNSAAHSIGITGGLNSFRITSTSAQERALMILEQRTGAIWKNRTLASRKEQEAHT